jgi:hypothetical protein
MWEPIAKEVALPWQRVESIYLQLQRERRITSSKTNSRSIAKSHEMLSGESATRSPPSQSVVRETHQAPQRTKGLSTGKIKRRPAAWSKRQLSELSK